MRNDGTVSESGRLGKSILRLAAIVLISISGLWLCGQSDAPTSQGATFATAKKGPASAAVPTRTLPGLDSEFPWGQDYPKVERRYKGLSRNWDDLDSLQLSRVAQYLLEQPCDPSIPLKQGKIRTRFRFTSHRLYEVEFSYLGRCATRARQVAGALISAWGQPGHRDIKQLPKGALFESRVQEDYRWETNTSAINLRYRNDSFKPGLFKRKITSLFVTFRARSATRLPGPDGEKQRIQLQPDKAITGGGNVTTVVLGGEIALTDKVLAASGGTWSGALQRVPLLGKNAMFIASLDGVLGEKTSAGNGHGSAPPEAISALAQAGLGAVMLPPLPDGCGKTTRRLLEASRIAAVVPGDNGLVIQRTGLRIGLMAFAGTTGQPGEATLDDIIKDIRTRVALLVGKTDAIVVGIYWRSRGTYCPQERERRLFETALGAGATVVTGYGNGVMGGMMQHNGGVAFYSPGTLVPAKKPLDPESLLLQVRLNKSGLVDYEPVALRLGSANRPLLPLPVQGAAREHILQRFTLLSQTCRGAGPPPEALTPYKKP